MKNRRYLGLSNVDLANALRRIAVNDSNKKKVMHVIHLYRYSLDTNAWMIKYHAKFMPKA